jgi:hypothetical protein
MTERHAVLLALKADPMPRDALAKAAGVEPAVASAVLERLVREHLAIREDEGYELTGPLSWFGDFGTAAKYFAGKGLTAAARGDARTHRYLCEVRVKGVRRSGDPQNETVSVFACGEIASRLVPGGDAVTCEECRKVV